MRRLHWSSNYAYNVGNAIALLCWSKKEALNTFPGSPAQLLEEPDLSAMRTPAVVACMLFSVSNGVGVGEDESCLLMRTMPTKASIQQRPSKTYRAIITPKVTLSSSTMKVEMLTASSNVARVRRGMLIRQSSRSPGCYGVSSCIN